MQNVPCFLHFNILHSTFNIQHFHDSTLSLYRANQKNGAGCFYFGKAEGWYYY